MSCSSVYSLTTSVPLSAHCFAVEVRMRDDQRLIDDKWLNIARAYKQVITTLVDNNQRTRLQQALLHFVQRRWLQATTYNGLMSLLYDSTNTGGLKLVEALDHVDRFWQKP
jgi:hypothetical protein